jgi:hypothetical protein
MKSDASVQDLQIVRDLGPIPADVVPLITIVHNEMPRLPDFLRHYRELGVSRFIIVDHRSTDASSEFLKRQHDVQLYRTEGNYDRTVSGQMWVTGIARHFAMHRWVLHVDADEFLVYDGMGHRSVRDLTALLERRGQTRLYAPMLDMYSRNPILENVVSPGQRLIDVAPYFDPLTADGFVFYERIKLPSRVALMGYNRSRVFGNLSIASESEKPIGFHMEKFPLSKWNDRTAYCCAHCPFPFGENPSTPLGALLHFRFVGNFIEFNKSVAELGEAWDGGSSYQAYVNKLKQDPALSLYDTHSRYFEGPHTLVSEGFIHAIDWN